MHKWLIFAVLVCGSVIAQTNEPCSAEWKKVRGKNLETGLSEGQVEHTLAACQQRGMTAEETDKLLAPVYAAHKEGLPCGSICVKVEEGMAKHVPLDRIEAAAQARLGHLRSAQSLVASLHGNAAVGGNGNGNRSGRGRGNGGGPGNYGSGSSNSDSEPSNSVGGQSLERSGMGGGSPRLIENIAMALESGVSKELLQQVFEYAGKGRMGRIMPIVDAAEALHLAGLSSDQSQRVLFALVEKKLNRKQIERVVESISLRLSSGEKLDDFYSLLWDQEKASNQHGEDHASGGPHAEK